MHLLCVGDVALADEHVIQHIWAPILPRTSDNEAKVLLNWELPIGDRVNPAPRSRGPRLMAYPDSQHVLRDWSPGFAALANNHILDAGEQGLVNMIESLNREGFSTVGAGRTCEDVARPLFWETAEGRLAIINWVFPETHPDWMAVPGPNCWPGIEEAKKIVGRVRNEADWVMVVAHWSDELISYPRPIDREVAQELAHMGVDLVIGHHPHVVRGMEIINSCPVFYSLGNFYFSDIPNHHGGWVSKEAPRNREGLGVQVSFARGQKPEYRIRSFWRTREKVIPDSIRRAHWRMKLASRPLQRFQGPEYADWHASELARFNKWGYALHFGIWHSSFYGLARLFYSKLVGRRLSKAER